MSWSHTDFYHSKSTLLSALNRLRSDRLLDEKEAARVRQCIKEVNSASIKDQGAEGSVADGVVKSLGDYLSGTTTAQKRAAIRNMMVLLHPDGSAVDDSKFVKKTEEARGRQRQW